jgi:hypothetical protein
MQRLQSNLACWLKLSSLKELTLDLHPLTKLESVFDVIAGNKSVALAFNVLNEALDEQCELGTAQMLSPLEKT